MKNSSTRSPPSPAQSAETTRIAGWLDRKSTRLNSSHQIISYAVFCLKKKKSHDNCREQLSQSRHIYVPNRNNRLHHYGRTLRPAVCHDQESDTTHPTEPPT